MKNRKNNIKKLKEALEVYERAATVYEKATYADDTKAWVKAWRKYQKARERLLKEINTMK